MSPKRLPRNSRRMNKAVFLDRDGVIVREVDKLHRLDQLRILPGAAKAIREINRLGYLAIVITNQAVVARGWITEAGVDEIHAVMIKRLSRQDAKIDAVYYCPHHPNADLKKYRLVCRCRKPNPGMILTALKKFNIDRRRSFMVGDKTGDILAGRRAGLKTILVATGYGGKDDQHEARPDFAAKDLKQAVAVIKKSAGGKKR